MIYVMLVEGTTPVVSQAIKLLTWSRFSHCGFTTDTKTYEADPPCLLTRELKDYPWRYSLYRIRGITRAQINYLIEWNERLLENPPPYDYGKVFGLGVYRLTRVDWARRLLDNQKRLECYEHVAAGLQAIGYTPNVSQMKGVPGDWVQDQGLIFVREGGPET